MSDIKFWIKAFIPREFEQLMITIPGGPHAGETAKKGPFPGSDCFLTDNRDFSSDASASCRMNSEISINPASLSTLNERHYCDPTVEVDCEDGDVECKKSADIGRMRFKNESRRGTILTVDLVGAANNPCFFGSPDIDYEGQLIFNKQTNEIEYYGKVYDFPAYEACVTKDGKTTKLFTHRSRIGHHSAHHTNVTGRNGRFFTKSSSDTTWRSAISWLRRARPYPCMYNRNFPIT